MAELVRQNLGVVIPNSVVFAVALAVHIPVGITAIVSGAVAALVRKRPGWHPIWGGVYHASLAVLFVTATIMASIRWSQDAHLFFFGAAAFASATLGRIARHHRWRNWPYVHVPGMGIAYITMLTAFYVDNGPHLSPLNLLPGIAFWVVPGLVGVPLILLALRSRQVGALVRQSRRGPASALADADVKAAPDRDV